MTRSAPAWLPLEVVERAAAQAPFDAALAAWRADWTPRLHLQIGSWTLKASEALRDGDPWRVPHRCVAVSCSARAKMRLASAALELDLETAQSNERDRAVLGGFCDRLLGDLAERFEGLLGAAADDVMAGHLTKAPRIVAAIEGEAGALIQIAAPARPLVALYHRALPRPAAAAKPLVDRLKALASSTVQLEAMLGEAAISLPELRAMAPGDVLRLNRKLTDPTSLCLAGGGFVAHAVLTHAEGRLALRLRQESSTGTKR